MRAIVFGATLSAKEMYRKIMEQYEIVAFADNDPNKQGGGYIWRACNKPSGYKELDLG